MKILNYFTSFQEVPNKLSICISAYGCTHHCPGCSWEGESEYHEFSIKDLDNLLSKYDNSNLLDCVCFLGGEWENNFKDYLSTCKKHNVLTCLYTGSDKFENKEVINLLDYLKTGHWDQQKGGLDSKDTNQVFMDLKANKKLNNLFWR